MVATLATGSGVTTGVGAAHVGAAGVGAADIGVAGAATVTGACVGSGTAEVCGADVLEAVLGDSIVSSAEASRDSCVS